MKIDVEGLKNVYDEYSIFHQQFLSCRRFYQYVHDIYSRMLHKFM